MSPLSASIPHGDEGRLGPLGHLNNLGDFQSVHLAHAASVNAEVLGKTVHSASFNRSLASDDTVTQCFVEEHVVIVGSVRDEGIHFQKRTFVEKQTDAVPCRSSATRPNGFLALQSTAKTSGFPLGAKLFQRMVGVGLHGPCTPFQFLIQTLTLSAFLGVLHRGWTRAPP